MSNESIGKRIKQIRGKESRYAFAEAMQIGTTTLQRYENDERLPDLEFLIKLHELSGLTLDYLITGNELLLPDEENLLLKNYRNSNPEIQKKILMLLLGVNETSQSVVKQENNTGKNVQYNATNQTIDHNSPATMKINIKRQKGDVVGRDKNVLK